MTRKDELQNMAAELRFELLLDMKDRHGFDRGYLPDVLRQEWNNVWDTLIYNKLQQVEREVLERVIAGYLRYKESLVPKPGCEKFPIPLIQTFEEWLRAQQKELG